MSQIVLTGQQSLALRQTAAGALKQTGRVEFGPGAVDPIIEAFSDSPYLTRENCEDALSQFIMLFYTFKNETLDRISDDALIRYMKSFRRRMLREHRTFGIRGAPCTCERNQTQICHTRFV